MADRIITVTDPSVVTNDTLSGYNNYSDQDGQLGTTMTPTEATNGHTVALSDGVVHEVTTKPVGTTNGEFAAVLSNAVTVDLSGGGGYVPSEQPNIRLALLSDTALPIDVGGTGNNVVTLAGHTDPTNSGGLNTFNGVDGTGDLTQLTTVETISINTGMTEIFEVAFDELTTTQTSYAKVGPGNGSAFGMASSGAFLISIGNIAQYTAQVSADFTQGIPRIVTIQRTVAGDVTIQFDDDTLINGSTNAANVQHDIRDFGGNSTLADRELACKLGRYIIFDALLTGQDLVNAKQWVADGTP